MLGGLVDEFDQSLGVDDDDPCRLTVQNGSHAQRLSAQPVQCVIQHGDDGDHRRADRDENSHRHEICGREGEIIMRRKEEVIRGQGGEQHGERARPPAAQECDADDRRVEGDERCDVERNGEPRHDGRADPEHCGHVTGPGLFRADGAYGLEASQEWIRFERHRTASLPPTLLNSKHISHPDHRFRAIAASARDICRPICDVQ